jgi:hypothetical protein
MPRANARRGSGSSWQQKKKVLQARRRKVLQGGHAATLQRTLGKMDCSQNDKMDRGGISLFSEMVNPPPFEGAQSTLRVL